MKRKKNRASDMPPPVAVDVEDDDPRLARRLRRRSVALQSSKLHSQRNYGLSNCNVTLAEVAGVDYILLDDDDDDGGENHADLDFSQSLGECDQAPTKIPSVKFDQKDVDAEEGKFEDVGSRAKVGEIHKVASTSPISKFSHIDDENRGERTPNNRVSSEELDIDHGLFCSALDSIHNENGGGHTHNNEEEREEVDIDCGCFCNLVEVQKCGTSNTGSTGVVVTEIVEHSHTNKAVVTGGFVHDVALDDNVAYVPPFATCNAVPIETCFMQLAFSENVDDFIGSGVKKNIDMVAADEADHDDSHNDDAGDDMDPHYKMYIEKLRQNGDSYFLEAPTINGVMEIVGYEACNEQYESGTVENPKAMGTFQASKQTNDERDFQNCSRRFETLRQRRARKRRDKMGTRGVLVTENLVVEEKMKKFVLDPSSSELNDHVSNRSSARVLGSVNSKIENMDVVDETYRNFLNCVRQEGSYVVFAPKNGKEMILEKYEESSADSEVIVVDVDPFSDDAHTPFVTSKYILVESDECIENSIGKSCLRFRDGVMEILEKPFDEKEYQDLLNEATLKRKVVRDKELRSGPKQFQLPGPGKSYLDQHRDLAAIIDSSENDKPKVLNLLRGFFYWLQRVAHNGVFKPWLDFSCLEVLPQ
ncbi:hypothetical protein K2173_023072 [Erythroxylum novogranatense]|uniref:Uncharacterized protein n=1 Tax=Erythroxylum novogranatense TaxID=1862640 RepID=A0AAV8T8L4_9ROSI|nr:hypothetical protein K2173_023072 [Erythroxylum novogranatense]